jgi:hypothetical protein
VLYDKIHSSSHFFYILFSRQGLPKFDPSTLPSSWN